jgi:hypothetical protein
VHENTAQKNADIYPCHEQDSNPWFQCSSGPGQYARPLGSAVYVKHSQINILLSNGTVSTVIIFQTRIRVDPGLYLCLEPVLVTEALSDCLWYRLSFLLSLFPPCSHRTRSHSTLHNLSS